MLNQETGLRGYALTRREDRLAPYNAGRAALDGTVAELGRLLEHDPAQTARLREAEDAARTCRRRSPIRSFAPPCPTPPRPPRSRGLGKLYFDQFRTRLDAIQTVERQTLAVQDRVLAGAQRGANSAAVIAGVITLAICGVAGLVINRSIVQPLLRLAAAMRRLAARDLGHACPRNAAAQRGGGHGARRRGVQDRADRPGPHLRAAGYGRHAAGAGGLRGPGPQGRVPERRVFALVRPGRCRRRRRARPAASRRVRGRAVPRHRPWLRQAASWTLRSQAWKPASSTAWPGVARRDGDSWMPCTAPTAPPTAPSWASSHC